MVKLLLGFFIFLFLIIGIVGYKRITNVADYVNPTENLKVTGESFAVTFILTWSFWIPAALLNKKIDSLPVIILIILGGIAGKLIPPTVLPYLA